MCGIFVSLVRETNAEPAPAIAQDAHPGIARLNAR